MTPAARIAGAIDILARIEAEDRPADGLVRGTFRARRYIGAKDRRAISELVYGVLRHLARLDWWTQRLAPETGGARGRVLAELRLSQGLSSDDLARLFDGAGYHPPPLEPAEQALVAALEDQSLDHPDQPLWVRGELPEWLFALLQDGLGAELADELQALGRPAPLDLRINQAKTTREAVQAALAAAEIESRPTPFSPLGLRLTGRHTLPSLAAYQDGLFEVQDEGSQLVALLCDAQPGLAVADLCAGAGGKTLALAAALGGNGRLVGLDLDARRLARAEPRLKRAGAEQVELRPLEGADDPWLAQEAGAFDRVLVDAPCSGSGAWRRQPDARWRLTPAQLEGYQARQAEILATAADLVRPGGRLIYATCSLLAGENQAQIDCFLAAQDDFRVLPIGPLWRDILAVEGPGDADSLLLTPARHGTDGFFVTILERVSGP